MILKAYSDGLLFGIDSMVISHELLKRVKNLENSLKVLGELQQVSQPMKEKEKTKEKAKAKMKTKNHRPLEPEQSMSRVGRPRFSLNGVLRFVIKNKKGNRYEKKQTVSSQKVKEHMSSEHEDSSASIGSSKEHGNSRISTVISKLMGLEEISSLKIEAAKSDDDRTQVTQQTYHVSKQGSTSTQESLAKKKASLKNPSTEENKVKTSQSPRNSEEELHSGNLRKQEKLNEDESRLMNVVIGNEELLNTIQATLELKIHVSIIEREAILDVDDENHECSKLTLDCALELMRRRLKIQEFKEHGVKFFIRRMMKNRSLVSIVKDLNNEMKAMVGDDVTWDLGWDSNMFKMNTTIVEDVEEIILSTLIDEVVRGFR